ncbi:MAG: SMI1/KNR4 family protein [Cyanobacteriota bacterium]|nr:SMI1/KNR4 family protein [Cyanobacteriota bacterium]
MSDFSIAEIQTKLDRLCHLDRQFAVFGSATHQYHLQPCLSESELLEFEQNYEVKLPPDYRQFLKCIGNGGAGPHYLFLSLEGNRDVSIPFVGKETLVRQQIKADWKADREILLQFHAQALLPYLRDKDIDRISTRALFKLADRLNLLKKQARGEFYTCYPDLLENNDIESYSDIELWDVSVTGFVPLFECGCDHRDILIVNGKEYGTVMKFSDSDRWLANLNQTFSEYYQAWLDEHLRDFDRCQELMNTQKSVREIELAMYRERMLARQLGERQFPGSSAIDLIVSSIDIPKPVELFGYPGQMTIRAEQTQWVEEQLQAWRKSR